jgi:hypothetical protein
VAPPDLVKKHKVTDEARLAFLDAYWSTQAATASDTAKASALGSWNKSTSRPMLVEVSGGSPCESGDPNGVYRLSSESSTT